MGFTNLLARTPGAGTVRWAWLLLFAGCIALMHSLPRSGGELVITLDAQSSGVAQVYFDSGHGIGEAESRQLPFRPGTNLLRFSLPGKSFRGFRFDPTASEGPVVVRQLELWRNGAASAEVMP